MRMGVVYVLETHMGHKIGITHRDISKRIKELSTCYEVKFVHAIVCHNPRGLEKQLHERFKHKRVEDIPSREIFSLSFADVMMIKSISNFRGKPCKHFASLVDAIKHTLAIHKRWYMSNYGR